MTKRICILALIGLPATGKTTFSNWLLKQPQAPFNVIHLCYDDHLEAMTEGEDNKPNAAAFEFKIQRKNILLMIQMVIDALKSNTTNAKLPNHIESVVKTSLQHHNNDYLIICDDNNYYHSMRYKLYQIARQNECAYAQIYFDGLLKLAMERNEARPAEQRVPQEIMQRMATRLEIPDANAQRWETNTCVLLADTKDYNIIGTKIVAFITKAFENKLLPMYLETSVDAHASVQSVVHQLDLLLRKRIGEILQSSHTQDASERQNLAKLLCDKRKSILHDVKVKYEKETSTSACVADLNEYVNLLY